MTTKFPLTVILMEIAVQAELRGVRLHLFWIPRDQNQEADGLTNFNTAPFEENLRVFPVFDFGILEEFMSAGEQLYDEMEARRAAGHGPPLPIPPRGRKKGRLRETQPW